MYVPASVPTAPEVLTDTEPSTASFADAPWSDNLKSADVGDIINEGESAIAFHNDYVYCVCNVAERSRIAVIPYGRSSDGGATWSAPQIVHEYPAKTVDMETFTGQPRLWPHMDPVVFGDGTLILQGSGRRWQVTAGYRF